MLDYAYDGKFSDVKDIENFDAHAKLGLSKLGRKKDFDAYPGKENGLKIPTKVIQFIKANKTENGIFVIINMQMEKFFHLFVYHITQTDI